MWEDAVDVLAHPVLGDRERSGDARVGTTLRHEREHLSFARAEPGQRLETAGSGDHGGDNLGIEDGRSGRHPSDDVDERWHVPDPVLQQVTDGSGP